MKGTVVLMLAGLVLTSTAALAGGPGCGTRIEGQITAIDPQLQQLVVNGITVQVTPTTVIKLRGQVITFDDLEVGMTVAACGTVENNVLTAKNITVKPQCRHD